MKCSKISIVLNLFFFISKISFCQSADDFFLKGQAEDSVRKYEDAAIAYTKAIQLDPKNDKYYYYRAISYYHTFFNDSLSYLDLLRAIELNPNNDIYYYQFADQKYQRGLYSEAVLYITKAIEIAPLNNEYYKFRAWNLEKSFRISEAVDDWTRLIKMNPQISGYYKVRGVCKLEIMNFLGAKEDFQKAIDNLEKDERYDEKKIFHTILIANAEIGLNNFLTAINICDLAIDYFNKQNDLSSLALAYRTKADAQMGLNQIAMAIANYSKSIELEPRFPEPYHKRALAKKEIKDFYGAIADCDKAISIDSTSFEYDLNVFDYFDTRANVNIELKNYSGAILDYTHLINLSPDNSWGYFKRALTKESLKNYSGALLDLDQAIKLAPDSGEYFFHRGLLKIKLKSKKKGCLDLSKAGELGYQEAYPEIIKNCQ